MEKKNHQQQEIKKTIRRTYGKIALQENNNESGSSSSCCAPGCCSGVLGNLWLYRTATFIGSSAVALLFRRKFKSAMIK